MGANAVRRGRLVAVVERLRWRIRGSMSMVIANRVHTLRERREDGGGARGVGAVLVMVGLGRVALA